MKRIAVFCALIAAGWAAQAATVDEAMTKAGCVACHAKDKKVVGPAFKDVAAKYKGQGADQQGMSHHGHVLSGQ